MNDQDYSAIEEKVYQITFVPGPSDEFTENLWKKISIHERKEPSLTLFYNRVFSRPGWAIVLLVLALITGLLFAFGPERVLASFRSLLGYLSPFSFINNLDETFALSKPVSQSQNGVTLTVEQVVANGQSITLIYHVEGLPVDVEFYPVSENKRSVMPVLRLPNGSALALVNSGADTDGGRCEFPPLPENVRDATFELPVLPLIKPGTEPENWRISFHLVPAQSIQEIGAVYDLHISSMEVNGVSIQLERVATVSDKTILQVGFNWQDKDWNFWGPTNFKLADDTGHSYDMASADALSQQAIQSIATAPVDSGTKLPGQHESHLYTTEPLDPSRTYTLSIQAISFGAVNLNQSGFRFDPGINAKVGQSWPLDDMVTAGGFTLHLISAHLVEGDLNGKYGLEFDIDPQPGIWAVHLFDENDQGRSSSLPAVNGLPIRSMFYFDVIPHEPILFQVGSIYFDLSGPWKLSWKPE